MLNLKSIPSAANTPLIRYPERSLRTAIPAPLTEGEYALPIAFLKAPLQCDFEVTNVTRLPGTEMHL